MQEVEVGGSRFRTGKLDAFQQFHVFRKLMPVFSGMGASFSQIPETSLQQPANGADAPQQQSSSDETKFWSALGPVAQAIADMSQADSEYVLKTCLQNCLIHNGTSWTRLVSPNGQIMFEDQVDMMAMLRLTFETIKDNLASFFPAVQGNGLAAGGFPFPSTLSP
jgi:hypothetical protein